MRDPELEEDCPGLALLPDYVKSDRDPGYNCVAFAVGDTKNFWYDAGIGGYYWPPKTPSADTMEGWLKVFSDLGYADAQDDSFEPEYEKIAIYANLDSPEHVARQNASGMWVSKMGKGHDIEHGTLDALEGAIMGVVVKIMKRPCKNGRRVLE